MTQTVKNEIKNLYYGRKSKLKKEYQTIALYAWYFMSEEIVKTMKKISKNHQTFLDEDISDIIHNDKFLNDFYGEMLDLTSIHRNTRYE